jgi:hypothetical protein
LYRLLPVFSGRTLEVQAGVSFDVNPSHAGRIVCNNSTIPTNVQFYIDYNTQCAAESNNGFQFSSWIQILEPNSSRIISISDSSDSLWNQGWSNLGLGSKVTSSDLSVARHGNFIASFEQLPPPIPKEYLVPLYGIIVSSIIGWSIPNIVTWYKSKKQINRLNSYHEEITSLCDNGKLGEKDSIHLNILSRSILNAYSEGLATVTVLILFMNRQWSSGFCITKKV